MMKAGFLIVAILLGNRVKTAQLSRRTRSNGQLDLSGILGSHGALRFFP